MLIICGTPGGVNILLLLPPNFYCFTLSNFQRPSSVPILCAGKVSPYFSG